MAKTTIQLEEKTRDRLKRLGTMSDTYDLLIKKLVEFYEEAHKRENFVETQHNLAKVGKFVELD